MGENGAILRWESDSANDELWSNDSHARDCEVEEDLRAIAARGRKERSKVERNNERENRVKRGCRAC